MDNEELLSELRQASKTGEIITIVYSGGSQPGRKRQIYPIKVALKEIRARDIATGDVKTFLVRNIDIVPDDYPALLYAPGVDDRKSYSTLDEALGSYIQELKESGWHIEYAANLLTLHYFFKNGKPKKTPIAGIAKYEDHSTRPWHVWGPDFATARAYSDLSKAINKFLEQARNHSPNNEQPKYISYP